MFHRKVCCYALVVFVWFVSCVLNRPYTASNYIIPILHLCVFASGLDVFGADISLLWGVSNAQEIYTVYGSYVHAYIDTRECVHVH